MQFGFHLVTNSTALLNTRNKCILIITDQRQKEWRYNPVYYGIGNTVDQREGEEGGSRHVKVCSQWGVGQGRRGGEANRVLSFLFQCVIFIGVITVVVITRNDCYHLHAMKRIGYSPFLRVIRTKLCFLIQCVILIGAIASRSSYGSGEVKGK